MGRKIPGKRHHGVKHPEVQRQRRDAHLKTKINSAPKNVDGQEIPHKMKLMMQAQEQMRSEQAPGSRDQVPAPKSTRSKLLDSTKHMGYEMKLRGMNKPLKAIPVFQQREGEPQKRFFHRMELQVQSLFKRKEYEKKFDVDVVDDPETGKPRIQERAKDELEEEADTKRKARLAKKGIVVRTKEEKRQMKRLKEKEKKLKKKRRMGKILNELGDDEVDFKEFEDFQDDIKFNDVAVAPPTLKNVVPKGKKDSLLLSQKLKKKTSVETMSLAKKHMLEQERTRVIEAYRSNKIQRLNKVKL